MVTIEQQLFTEVFPIDVANLPELIAYRVVMKDDRGAKIGGKLAYRLRRSLPGNWVWAGGRILTDSVPNPVKLLMAVDAAIKEQPDIYKKLTGVEQDTHWEPTAELIADFMVRGPLDKLGDSLREALAKTSVQLRNAHVERDHRVRPWVVNGQPALSFSVMSRLIYDFDLSTFASKLDKQAELVGVRVMDKIGTMQGEIVKVVGKLGEHRERLLKLSQRESTREMLRNAPDDDVVVRVSSGQNEYDYAGSALQVLLGLDDARRFEVNTKQAAIALRVKPSVRAQMVKIIADIVKAQKLVSNAYSTQNAPEPFGITTPSAEIVFGNNRTRPYDVQKIPLDFTSFGAYWWRERFQTEPVRVGIINTLDEAVDDFMEALKRLAKSEYHFNLELVRERKVRVVSQSNLESAVRVLQKEAIDLMIAFFENEPDDEEDEGATGQYIKAQTIGRGLPCLVIHESTMHKPEAMPNLVMGIIGRAGNVPYLLDDPLPYTDYVVGLDLIHHHKKEGDTVTGLSRIYRNDGALLRYAVASAPVNEEEGIPADVLARLLPADVLAGTRVIIHNNGRLGREELRALGGWEAELDGMLLPVEIMRWDVPRLYALEGGKINRAPWGTAFKLSETEAFVVTSSAPDDATPQPLHVRTDALPIDEALHSVTMFTLLHYGALKTPKMPVTVHHAEHIRASVKRGVIPEALEGDVPFWL